MEEEEEGKWERRGIRGRKRQERRDIGRGRRRGKYERC